MAENPIGAGLHNLSRSIQSALQFEAQRRQQSIQERAQELEAQRSLESLRLSVPLHVGEQEIALAREQRQATQATEQLRLQGEQVGIARAVQQETARHQAAVEQQTQTFQQGQLRLRQQEVDIQRRSQGYVDTLNRIKVQTAQLGLKKAEADAKFIEAFDAIPMPLEVARKSAQDMGITSEQWNLGLLLVESRRKPGEDTQGAISGGDFRRIGGMIRDMFPTKEQLTVEDATKMVAQITPEGQPIDLRQVDKVMQYSRDPEGTMQQSALEGATKDRAFQLALSHKELFTEREKKALVDGSVSLQQALQAKLASTTDPARLAGIQATIRWLENTARQDVLPALLQKYGDRWKGPRPAAGAVPEAQGAGAQTPQATVTPPPAEALAAPTAPTATPQRIQQPNQFLMSTLQEALQQQFQGQVPPDGTYTVRRPGLLGRIGAPYQVTVQGGQIVEVAQ